MYEHTRLVVYPSLQSIHPYLFIWLLEPVNIYHICLLSRWKFSCYIQTVNFVGTYFHGCYFCGHKRMHTFLLIPPLEVMTRRYGRLVTERY